MKRLLFSLLLLIVATPALAAGALQITHRQQSAGVIPRNAVRIGFLEIHMRAQDGDVTVSEIVVRRTGLSTSDDVGRVWAETNRYQRSLRSGFFNDDTATLRFPRGVFIGAGETLAFTVYANMQSDGGGSGRTVGITLDHIVSDAKETAAVSSTVFRNQVPPRKTAHRGTPNYSSRRNSTSVSGRNPTYSQLRRTRRTRKYILGPNIRAYWLRRGQNRLSR